MSILDTEGYTITIVRTEAVHYKFSEIKAVQLQLSLLRAVQHQCKLSNCQAIFTTSIVNTENNKSSVNS